MLREWMPWILVVLAGQGGEGAQVAQQIQQAMAQGALASGEKAEGLPAGGSGQMAVEKGDQTVNPAEAMLGTFLKMKPEQAAGMFHRYAQRGGVVAEGVEAEDIMPVVLAASTAEEIIALLEGMPTLPLASRLVELARSNGAWLEAWLAELRRLDDLASEEGAR